MTSDNYDFGGHIEDDTDVSPRRHTDAQEERLSPYGLIVSRVGQARGFAIFSALQRLAERVTQEHGGIPAIVFDVEGGRFVSVLGSSDGGRGF